jgi:hypothetical protein
VVPSKPVEDRDKFPSTLASINTLSGTKVKKLFIALLDSGGSDCLIQCSALPLRVQEQVERLQSFNTTAGQFSMKASVIADKLFIPELLKALHL